MNGREMHLTRITTEKNRVYFSTVKENAPSDVSTVVGLILSLSTPRELTPISGDARDGTASQVHPHD